MGTNHRLVTIQASLLSYALQSYTSLQPQVGAHPSQPAVWRPSFFLIFATTGWRPSKPACCVAPFNLPHLCNHRLVPIQASLLCGDLHSSSSLQPQVGAHPSQPAVWRPSIFLIFATK